MPPRKRTSTVADSNATQSPAKRARKPAETAASSRPKRVPQLPPRAAKTAAKTKATATTATKPAASRSTSSNVQETPRKRGRPSLKAAAATSVKEKPAKSSTPVKKAVGRPKASTTTTAKAIKTGKLPKRRGRPPKTSLPSSAEITVKKRKRTVRGSKQGVKGLLKKSIGKLVKKQTATRRPRKPSHLKEKEPDLTIEVAEEDAFGPDGRSYWLMKAEPESRLVKGIDVKFSIDDLRAATAPEPWDGVRNPVARNNMRAMKQGDYAFFYHSSCKVPGIVGQMEIVREHSVDESAFDPSHPYYDEKSNRENPKWEVVHVEFRRKFNEILTLETLKSHALPGEPLENMQTLRQSRVSVSRVTPQEWNFIMDLIDEDGNEPDAKADKEAEETANADTEAAAPQPTSEPIESGPAATATDGQQPLEDASQSADKPQENGAESTQVDGEKPNENSVTGQTTTEHLTSVIKGAFLAN